MINQSTSTQRNKKEILYFLLVVYSFLLFPRNLNAQTESSEESKNIIEKIQEDSDGKITIEISEPILAMIMQNPTGKSNADLKPGVNKLSGYRIQVFGEGRNPNTLESRAKARGNAILSKFPKYKGQVYTFSNSPNWYTRIGNFRTSAEANEALKELKKEFPSFSTDMRVVRSQIVIIK